MEKHLTGAQGFALVSFLLHQGQDMEAYIAA